MAKTASAEDSVQGVSVPNYTSYRYNAPYGDQIRPDGRPWKPVMANTATWSGDVMSKKKAQPVMTTDRPAVLDTDVYQDRAGDWRWRVTSATNGNIVATSGEGYRRAIDCRRMLCRIAEALLEKMSGYRVK